MTLRIVHACGYEFLHVLTAAGTVLAVYRIDGLSPLELADVLNEAGLVIRNTAE